MQKSLGFAAVAAIALFFCADRLNAAEDSSKPDDASEQAGEKDWLEFYYEKPDPARLVAEVNEWKKAGLFQNESAQPAIIAFLSQVFRQNRDRISTWYDQLTDLSDQDKKMLHTAMLYSRTSEADALLRQKFGQSFDEQKQALPKILELNLASKHTLDMLWGFFYATGSEEAIRRIIWAFRFADAPVDPKFANVPDGYKPLYTTLPDAAAWMLKSNGERHPKVVEICEKLYKDEKALVPTERRYLREVLGQLKPESFPPQKRDSNPE